MILSILICSINSRAGILAVLLGHLENQIRAAHAQDTVELLVNLDNKQKSTGRKRQELIEEATGDYVIFIDDDDWVEDFYLSEIIRGCRSGKDCLAINGSITTNGHNRITWRISKDYENVTIKEMGRPVYLRTTNHITAVKRELALQAGFPDKSNAEDKAYSDSLKPLLKTEFKIMRPLYHYKFSTHNKEYV